MRDTAVAFGATPLSDHRFRVGVWAPGKSGVSRVISSATEKVIPLELRRDFHSAEVDALQGARFMFRMPEGQNFPVPAWHFQPWGVDRPSQSLDRVKFRWTDPEFPLSSKS